MPAGHIYILSSASGTLYIGVTSKLFKRILQHRDGTYEGFSKKYGCHRLLYYEGFEDIATAIAREKQLKGWTRAKKLNLIQTKNPTCRDLAEHWGTTILFAGESIEEYEAWAAHAPATTPDKLTPQGTSPMTPKHQALLNASVDQIVEIEALDGTRFLATPLFVYEGEDNPDVFFLPVERLADETFKTAEAGQSILLEDIEAVRKL